MLVSLGLNTLLPKVINWSSH